MPALDSSKILAYAQAHAAANTASIAKNGTGLSLNTAFHDLLDIVNPLQHLPVVGTLYRAITGDKIGTLERIAGDTLYGGLWGAVSSVADTAFEAVTGKDFGATVLAFVTGLHEKSAAVVASAPTATPVRQLTAPPAAQADGDDVVALTRALSAKGVAGDLSSRALFAYQQSQSLANSPLAVN